jgi:hypothetical protein
MRLATCLNIRRMAVSIPLITAPKTDTAEAQGDWTWLAHQSNPDQHDGRNNEVWGFGYNVDDTWSSRNGLDDGFSSRVETHYYPSTDIGPQMEVHVVGISKAAGANFGHSRSLFRKQDPSTRARITRRGLSQPTNSRSIDHLTTSTSSTSTRTTIARPVARSL